MTIRTMYCALGVILAAVAVVSFAAAAVNGNGPRVFLTVLGLLVVALAGTFLAVGIKAGGRD